MRGKIDVNQKQIVTELRDAGYNVFSIADLKNCCDLIVTNGKSIILVEVKNPRYCKDIRYMTQRQRAKFLTKGEAKFAELFKVWIIVSAKEIINILNHEN